MTTRRLLDLILFLAIFTMAVRLPADTDTWWHLRAGQYIVETRTIPTVDPFSHTRAGLAWIDHGWLAQIGWYGLFALGGWPGLSLGLAALVTLSFWLIWRVTPGNPFIRAFITLLGAMTSAVIWVARPQMVSFMLAALILFILEHYKRSAKSKDLDSIAPIIYALPLLIMLWANIHGGYAIAFMLIAAYLLGETMNHLTHHTDDPVMTWLQMKQLVIITALSFLLVAVNPHTWQMWLYPFRTVNISVLRDFIQEWRSPDFHQAMTWPFIGMVLLTLTVISQARRRVDWSDLALLGMWTTLSLFAGRNIGLYGLLTVPALARYTDAVIGRYLPPLSPPPIRGGMGGVALIQGNRKMGGKARLNIAIVALLVVAALLKIGVALSPQARETYLTETLPVKAAEFIQRTQPAGPMFNSYNWGGYLIFTLWPTYPVYVDGRTDLYDDVFLRRYFNTMKAGDGWQQALQDDNINLVFIEHDSILAKLLRLDPQWQSIYEDDIAIIFEKIRN